LGVWSTWGYGLLAEARKPDPRLSTAAAPQLVPAPSPTSLVCLCG